MGPRNLLILVFSGIFCLFLPMSCSFSMDYPPEDKSKLEAVDKLIQEHQSQRTEKQATEKGSFAYQTTAPDSGEIVPDLKSNLESSLGLEDEPYLGWSLLERILLSGILTLLFFFYTAQLIFCRVLGKEVNTRLFKIFDGKSKSNLKLSSYSFFILAIFVPLMFGTVPQLAEIAEQSSTIIGNARAVELANMRISSEIIHLLCSTILTILIAIEFTVLSNLPEDQSWRDMLVVALALDLITLLVFNSYIFDSSEKYIGDMIKYFVVAVCILALWSSFTVISYIRKLNRINDENSSSAIQQAQELLDEVEVLVKKTESLSKNTDG